MTQLQAAQNDPLTNAQKNVMADIYHHVLHLQQQVQQCNTLCTAAQRCADAYRHRSQLKILAGCGVG